MSHIGLGEFLQNHLVFFYKQQMKNKRKFFILRPWTLFLKTYQNLEILNQM